MRGGIRTSKIERRQRQGRSRRREGKVFYPQVSEVILLVANPKRMASRIIDAGAGTDRRTRGRGDENMLRLMLLLLPSLQGMAASVTRGRERILQWSFVER